MEHQGCDAPPEELRSNNDVLPEELRWNNFWPVGGGVVAVELDERPARRPGHSAPLHHALE